MVKTKECAEILLAHHNAKDIERLFSDKASVFGPKQTIVKLQTMMMKVAKDAGLRRNSSRPSVSTDPTAQTIAIIQQRYVNNPSGFFAEIERLLDSFSRKDTLVLLDTIDRVWSCIELLNHRREVSDVKRPKAKLMDILDDHTGDKFESGNPRTVQMPYKFLGMLNEAFLLELPAIVEKAADKPYWQLTDKSLFGLVVKDLLDVNVPTIGGGFKLTPRLQDLDPGYPVMSQLLFETLHSRLDALGLWWATMFARATDAYYEVKEAKDVYDVMTEQAFPYVTTTPV